MTTLNLIEDDTEETILACCDACNCELEGSAEYYSHIQDAIYCAECYDDRFCTCAYCNDETELSDVTYVGHYQGEAICPSCIDRHYSYCDCCERYHISDDVNYSERTEQSVCSDCWDCDIHEENKKSEVYGFAEYSELYNPTPLDYGDKPKISFIREKTDKTKNELYYGIELEMNFSCNFYRVYDITKKYLYGKFIYKEDGSLSDGAELVTVPMTLAAIKKIDWKRLFKALQKIGVTSHVKNECGLHVHSSYNSNDFNIFTNIFFAQNNFKIKKLSRRSNYRYCKLMEIVNEYSDDNDQEITRKYLQTTKTELRDFLTDSHYVAISKTLHTNELRIFRGTLRYESFLASIEFYDALIYYYKQNYQKFLKLKYETKTDYEVISDKLFSFQNFYKTLNHKKYDNLKTYITYRGL